MKNKQYLENDFDSFEKIKTKKKKMNNNINENTKNDKKSNVLRNDKRFI